MVRPSKLGWNRGSDSLCWGPVRDETRSTLSELFAGRYTVHERLNWGGLALMYRASTLDRGIVIAVLPLDCEANPENGKLFHHAMQTVSEVHDGALVPIIDRGVQLGVPFVAYEHVEAVPLAAVMSEGGKLHPRRALSIARRLLDTLAAVHEVGTCHGDLTPANVLVDPDDQIFVLGLGIAHVLRGVRPADVTGPTGRGSGKGAVRYLSPEVLGGGRGDAAGDLFSVGALLEHMITGEPPSSGVSSGSRFDLVPGLRAVIERAMRYSPDERFASADEMRRALALDVLEKRRRSAPAPADPLWKGITSDEAQTPFTPARRSMWPWAAALLFLGGAGAAAYWVGTSSSEVASVEDGTFADPSSASGNIEDLNDPNAETGL